MDDNIFVNYFVLRDILLKSKTGNGIYLRKYLILIEQQFLQNLILKMNSEKKIKYK